MRKRMFALAGVMAVAAMPALATPASAVTRCETTDARYVANIQLVAKICVERHPSTGKFQSRVTLSWTKLNNPGGFTQFEVYTRLERNDAMLEGRSCDDFKTWINSRDSGAETCATSWSTRNPPLTGDGTIYYNTGPGQRTWELPGTSAIR
ncbi:hypothetical protein ACFYT4_25630 [Streptomyces sp. NPDC004609]|uniref:hypothetical protein n=1 Tax=Streptomyces sp. NPDC004609 TaxID=3364704 RepID=UPI0036C2548A